MAKKTPENDSKSLSSEGKMRGRVPGELDKPVAY